MEQSFYNAKLQMLTDSEAVYQWQERILRVSKLALSERLEHQVGQVGVLVIDEEGEDFGVFIPVWSNACDV